jgi:TorA maturation chaperone TorD
LAIAEEDNLRAQYYALLARLMAEPPAEDILQALRRLSGDGTEIGRSLGMLSSHAAKLSAAQVADEFHVLIIGLAGGELRPYASVYMTGFLYEKPLAALRRSMAALGIARAAGSSEPEDHIATLCDIMHGLIVGRFGEAADLATQRTFFDAHLEPWAWRFFADLEKAGGAHFYRPVGTMGRKFIAIEREAFALAA